jgi:aryl-alcohol dehydrogenase-like predicted oxidoreductase
MPGGRSEIESRSIGDCRSLHGLRGSEWLQDSELRIGLGCMRLPAEEELALETIAAALSAGVSVFDTARAYAPAPAEDGLGHNERLLARALRSAGGQARIVTKGGMTRPGGGWVPDGRAKAIRADCEASLEALGGLPIDLYLLHAPDPRTPWATSVRALARLIDDGLVERVGLSNVNRDQLEQACELAPITAAEVGVSVLDDRVLRGGVIEFCAQRGIAVIAHSPLGGPRRAAGLARRADLAEVASEHGATAAEVALAWVLGLPGDVVAIAGARRPSTATSAARAASLALSATDRERLRPTVAARASTGRPIGGEIVLVMGVAGAGKSRIATEYVARGYARLNRDEAGGTLRDLAIALDDELAGGARRVVLDNTYLTRASRSYVLEVADRHGCRVRCVWLVTQLDQAQINLVERLLDRFGSVPSPDQIRAAARGEPGLMLPTSQMRTFRELEKPTPDEGFAAIERIEFERAVAAGRRPGGVLISAAALALPGARPALANAAPGSPHLVFDWRPEGVAGDLNELRAEVAELVGGHVEAAVCPHGGGPPSCWCRPPLPGLALGFARAHNLDPAGMTVISATTAHRTLARALGARYVDPG